jgi:Rap1a immunity proteins
MNISRVLRIALMSAVVFLVPLHARAERPDDLTGYQLLARCEQPEGSFGRSGCRHYLLGMGNLNSLHEQMDRQPLFFCTPQGVTMGQTEYIIIKYFKEHPERLHYKAVLLAALALGEAFPCKR